MFRSDLDEVAKLTGVRPRRAAPPAATLMPVSPAILDRPADWPQSVHLTGPWREGNGSAPSPKVADFVARGGFVYAGFGSMAVGDATARARTVVDGIRRYGTRALLATGLGGLMVPDDLRGDDVLVVQSVDHEAVFPRAEAAVIHGGIGTVQAAAGAGTVAVIVPFIADQPFWGARLHARGLSPAPIPQRRLTPARLAMALADAEQCRSAAAAAARTMATEDGTGAALTVLGALA
jgi:sterol 3beta-glucosyltransferase